MRRDWRIRSDGKSAIANRTNIAEDSSGKMLDGCIGKIVWRSGKSTDHRAMTDVTMESAIDAVVPCARIYCAVCQRQWFVPRELRVVSESAPARFFTTRIIDTASGTDLRLPMLEIRWQAEAAKIPELEIQVAHSGSADHGLPASAVTAWGRTGTAPAHGSDPKTHEDCCSFENPHTLPAGGFRAAAPGASARPTHPFVSKPGTRLCGTCGEKPEGGEHAG